jgi:hypothetical protein
VSKFKFWTDWLLWMTGVALGTIFWGHVLFHAW